MSEKTTTQHGIGQWVIVTTFDSHWMDFKCYDRIYHGDNEYSFYADDELNFSALTEDIDKALPSREGVIKWDGCYQVTSISDMPLHWDSRKTLDAFCAMLKHIPLLAKQMDSWEGEYEDSEE